MLSQTRKLRRLYAQKLKALTSAVKETFGKNCQIITGAAGSSRALTMPCPASGDQLIQAACTQGLRLEVLKETEETISLVLSCSSIPLKDFLPACQLLKTVTDSFV